MESIPARDDYGNSPPSAHAFFCNGGDIACPVTTEAYIVENKLHDVPCPFDRLDVRFATSCALIHTIVLHLDGAFGRNVVTNFYKVLIDILRVFYWAARVCADLVIV
jgi:hypothetical protein